MPLIRLFLDIALFSKGPQDAPGSRFLLGLALAADLAVGLGLALLDLGFADGIAQSAASMALLAGFLWITLYLNRRASRFTQTAIAAFGCDALISAAAFPFLVWSRFTVEGRGMAELLILLLLVWQVSVVGHILRHALSTSFMAGFGFAVIYTLGSIRLMMALFPGAG